MSHDFWLRPDSRDPNAPTTRYQCIVADPPWLEQGGGNRGANAHYSIMSTPAIARTMLQSPMWRPHSSCHLWLWTTSNFLVDAMAVIDRLEFRYVRDFIWVKTEADEPSAEEDLQQGLGQYARGSHELCLLAVRGAAMLPDVAPKSVIFAPRTRHSAKPEKAFTHWFERVSPGPRLEMFARASRFGWDAWGDQAPAKVIAFPVGPDDDTPVCR